MLPSLNQQAPRVDLPLPAPSSKRTQPRPKVSSKVSPLSKNPLAPEVYKQAILGVSKPPIKDPPEQNILSSVPEIDLKQDFHNEMKAFVHSKQRESQLASLRAKMSVVCNFLECLSPFVDSDRVSFDFIRDFATVGKSLLRPLCTPRPSPLISRAQ